MYIRSIAIAGLLIGILFKFLHWPWANLILLSCALLATVTIVILLVTKPGPWSVRIERPWMILVPVSLALMGVVFKLMHWPGANIMLLLGMTASAAWFLVPQAGTRSAA